MICLSEELRKSILERLGKNWSHIITTKLPKNRNEIVLCTNASPDTLFYKQPYDDKKNHNPNITNGTVMNQFKDITKNSVQFK